MWSLLSKIFYIFKPEIVFWIVSPYCLVDIPLCKFVVLMSLKHYDVFTSFTWQVFIHFVFLKWTITYDEPQDLHSGLLP
jgi:hypothetical protein